MKKPLVALIALGSVLALSLPAEPNYKGGQELTGSWRLSVSIPPGSSACPPGSDPCVFLALANASSDGNVIQTAALPGTSTGHGVWKRIGLRQFTIRSTYFRLDPEGFPVGTAETVSTVELTSDGLSASGAYVNTLLDLDGNELGGFEATVTATRLEP